MKNDYMEKYDYFLFDLDGTLSDPGIGITNSVMYALKKYGIEVTDRSELYSFIGPPLKDSFMKNFGFYEEQALEAITYYREYFHDRGIFENELYPDTSECLKRLKAAGKTIIMATSKPEEFAVRILKHFNIDGYFDYACGATMDETRNKKDEVIAYAMKQAGIKDLSRAVMIGDREHDIIGAKKNGVDSIGVLCGYGNREELEKAGATYIVEGLGSL